MIDILNRGTDQLVRVARKNRCSTSLTTSSAKPCSSSNCLLLFCCSASCSSAIARSTLAGMSSMQACKHNVEAQCSKSYKLCVSAVLVQHSTACDKLASIWPNASNFCKTYLQAVLHSIRNTSSSRVDCTSLPQRAS
jgi:hypothetical protein